MSYRRAWLLVEEVNNSLREPAITAEKGGRHGGGAALTAVGERVVDLYRTIELHARSAAAGEFRAIGKLVRGDKSIKSCSIRKDGRVRHADKDGGSDVRVRAYGNEFQMDRIPV